MRTALLALTLLLPLAAAAQDPAWLTPDQVRTVLRARGYSEIGSLERDGNSFVIRNATRYGEKVPEARVDALTGLPREAPPLTENQARAMLQERGYAEVREVARDGNTIRLRATRDGTPTELAVDAQTGTVRR